MSTTICVVLNANAQNYPTRPVRIVVPFPPGGSVDIVARLLAQKLEDAYKNTFVVDNRPGGAGGTIGIAIAANAEANGYTLLLTSSTYAINPSIFRKLPYDVNNSFGPISLVASAPNLLVVHPSLAVTTVGDLLALVRKAPPGSMNYASAGVATPTHLAALLFSMRTGVSLENVPYRGGGPALTALVGGEVKLMFPGIVSALPLVKSERLRALGVTSLDRVKIAPAIPSIAETHPGFEAVNWFSMLAPKKTASEIVRRLNMEINKAIQNPDVVQTLEKSGASPLTSSPITANQYIKSETEKWRSVLAQAGITAE